MALVDERPDGNRGVREVSTHVEAVFRERPLAPLATPEAIARELGRLRNVLGQARDVLIVVHDYEGVGAWFEGR